MWVSWEQGDRVNRHQIKVQCKKSTKPLGQKDNTIKYSSFLLKKEKKENRMREKAGL